MLTVSVMLSRFLLPLRFDAAAAAWACFWAGTALCYGLLLLRLAGAGPGVPLAVGFAPFHAGLAASLLASVLGLRRGWAFALAANGFPVGLYWLGAWSVPAFFARFH